MSQSIIFTNTHPTSDTPTPTDGGGSSSSGGGSSSSSDTTPPTLVSLSPLSLASNVAIDSNITFTFSEDVQYVGGYIKIFKNYDDYSMVESFTTGSNISFVGANIILNPTNSLNPSGQYDVLFNMAITDLNGNSYSYGVSQPYQFITAGAADTTPPTFVSSSPLNNATGVAIDSNIFLGFSEAIKSIPLGEIYFKANNDFVQTLTEGVGITFFDDYIALNPANNLLPLTEYKIIFNGNVLSDLSDNDYDPINPTGEVLIFTTAGAAADTTPPTFDVAPSITNIGTTSFDLNASIDEVGVINYIVIPDGSTAPSVEQILEGRNASGG